MNDIFLSFRIDIGSIPLVLLTSKTFLTPSRKCSIYNERKVIRVQTILGISFTGTEILEIITYPLTKTWGPYWQRHIIVTV